MAALLALGACSGEASPGAAEEGLRVSYQDQLGSEPVEATLTCAPPLATGFLVGREEELCRDLEQQLGELQEAPGEVCTQVYAGPEVAKVAGQLFGTPVSVVLGRSDGCLIEQWASFTHLVEPSNTEATG